MKYKIPKHGEESLVQKNYECLKSLGIEMVVSMDDGRNVKCPRCWHWHGVVENFDNLCNDCQQTILTDFPNHASVPGIREALAKQREKDNEQH